MLQISLASPAKSTRKNTGNTRCSPARNHLSPNRFDNNIAGVIFLFRFIFWGMIVLALSFWDASALALTNRFTTLLNVPAMSDGDFITTMGPQIQGKNKWRAFTQADYGYRPFEATNAGARVRGIIDHLLIQNFGLAFSLVEKTEFEIMLPVIWINEFSTPDVLATNFSNKMGVGDLYLRTRFQILPENKLRPGLTLVPFLTLPTGNEHQYTSNANPTGGLHLVLGKSIAHKYSLGFNLGLTAREPVTFLDYTTKFLVSGSFAAKAEWTSWFSTTVDVYTSTKVKSPFQKVASSPIEALSQIAFKIPESKWKLSLGGGYSLLRGSGMPLFRGILGLSYGSSPLPESVGTSLPASSY